MKKLILFLLIAGHCTFLHSQHRVYDEINQLKSSGSRSVSYAPFKFQSADVQNSDFNLTDLKKGTVLNLDLTIIQKLHSSSNDFISLSIPVSDRSTIVLILKRHEIFAPDFALFASSNRQHPIDYNPGLHYEGIIEGDPNSLVGLSVFKNQIMAFISNQHGNSLISLIQGDKEFKHVFYTVEDQDQKFDFECSGPDDGLAYTADQLYQSPNKRDLNDCVRLYLEIDDELVTTKGGVVPATDYLTGIVNQSIVVFANEQINMVISEILAWNVSSPYSVFSSTSMMSSFQSYTGFYNGDLAMMVNYTDFTGHAYGILNGLCNPNPDLTKCILAMNHTNDFLNVTGTCHVFGHLLGSKHTHECVWNGNNTSIDGCFYAGGNSPCPGPDPGYPPNGGTMMSYCSPGHGWFYNLAEGFGPQPGNIIRNSVNQAGNCLLPCGPPILYCLSNGANASNKFIKKVTLGSINNESGFNYGYGNFISLNASLNAGASYIINLTPGHAAQTKYWRVWIDYNNDQDWADAGEQVGQGSGSGSSAIAINFTVPINTSSVTTRMRVSMSYGTYPPICGEFTEGEVEDYTINITGTSGATCSDGIQNQGETGIDCGGPCSPCTTCSDGIQNQGETGIDCGGPCPACAGGSVILLASYFETGWDSWIDGGSDATRVNSANSYEGLYSIRLADNAGIQSAMTSPTFNLSDATSLEISFHYYAASMEAGEDFWVLYNSGSTWVTIASYVSGTNFNNNSFYSVTVTVPNFVPTATGSLRIQCDAGDNSDQVYIDQVIITKLTGGPIAPSVGEIHNYSLPVLQYRGASTSDGNKKLTVYPNPANDLLNLNFNGEINNVRIVDVDGRRIQIAWARNTNQVVDISTLSTGIYFIWAESGGQWYPTKFSKM